METQPKPLQPLDFGNILIVGTKQSNFGEEIKNHPRVVMWDGQDERWLGKELPTNVRAVFLTRFIGHNAFEIIVKEARKKRITIFNPTGTGVIARQIKELLDLNKPEPIVDAGEPIKTVEVKPVHKYDYNEDDIPALTTTTTEDEMKSTTKGKLNALVPLIDFNKTNIENARVLIKDAVGKTSTLASLANFVGAQRKRRGGSTPARKYIPRAATTTKGEVDVAVQLLDNMMKELKDMRDYLIATTKENQMLKARVNKLKNVLGGE